MDEGARSPEPDVKSYSRLAFERTVEEIRTGYLAILKSLHDRLAGEIRDRIGIVDHGLSDRQMAILREVLSGVSDRFDRVGLFGSRATGRARAASDIDLVVFGARDPRLADTLFTLLDESGLPMTVDVVDHDRIDHPPLRHHIDAVVQPLFTAAELRAHPPPA